MAKNGASQAELPNVFISHSTEDAYVASCLRSAILKQGARAFLDTFDVEAGDKFNERILDGLKRCTELVVLLTPWAAESRWVHVEIGIAASQDKRVVAFAHGMTIPQLLHDRKPLPLLEERHLMHLNDFPKYLKQLRSRVRTVGKS